MGNGGSGRVRIGFEFLLQHGRFFKREVKYLLIRDEDMTKSSLREGLKTWLKFNKLSESAMTKHINARIHFEVASPFVALQS